MVMTAMTLLKVSGIQFSKEQIFDSVSLFCFCSNFILNHKRDKRPRSSRASYSCHVCLDHTLFPMSCVSSVALFWSRISVYICFLEDMIDQNQ
ncbi:hypothetical protein A4A49_19853 [Nicotiana attenuata]|uniref:Uncharacterized protein n=1 Tax=Nicotiana attenuata TaxID=49451 RepID=A0A314KHM9_NICAT|nr:hypothetical protein A4A49_19853 [Nicotiana attenuata]